MRRDWKNFAIISTAAMWPSSKPITHIKKKKGNPYRCRIDVTVARGHELVADERRTDNGSHQPLNKIIHDAFKTMERELCRVVDKQRRDVKTHADSRSPK